MLEAGDILLVRGNTPIISRSIRWFTGSAYTHVAMFIQNGWVFEIDFNKKLGIHPMSHEDYDAYRYKKGLSLEQKTDLLMTALERAEASKGYDWLRILGFSLEKLFNTKKTYDWMNREVCSEIVDNLYDSIGIDLVPDRANGYVTPGHLALSAELIQVYSSKGASHK